jgi:hypothetical protein
MDLAESLPLYAWQTTTIRDADVQRIVLYIHFIYLNNFVLTQVYLL